MRRSPGCWLSAFLGVLLVVSNGWWMLQELNAGVTEEYREQMSSERQEILREALAVMPALAAGLPQDEVLARVRKALPAAVEPCEKEGLWIADRLQFQFDRAGQLREVQTRGGPLE